MTRTVSVREPREWPLGAPQHMLVTHEEKVQVSEAALQVGEVVLAAGYGAVQPGQVGREGRAGLPLPWEERHLVGIHPIPPEALRPLLDIRSGEPAGEAHLPLDPHLLRGEQHCPEDGIPLQLAHHLRRRTLQLLLVLDVGP